MPNTRNILLAVDTSAASRRAVSYVANLLESAPNFHVGLLHLELPPRMLEWGGSEDVEVEDKVSSERASDYQALEKEAVKAGQDQVQGLRRMLTDKGVDVAALLVQFEEPLDPQHIAKHILKTAAERNYGTVAVGRHSFSGLKRFFGHHVDEELVRTGKGIAIWVVE